MQRHSRSQASESGCWRMQARRGMRLARMVKTTCCGYETGRWWHALGGFLTAVRTEMALGAGGEDVAQLPRVALTDLPRRPVCEGSRGGPFDPRNTADVIAALNTCAIPINPTP
jgi:hypothetical protein